MDVSKILAALGEATKELNTVTDAEFTARRLKGLRPLTLAQGAIDLAVKHVNSANTRTTETAAAPAGGGEAKPAAKKAGK